MPQLIPSLTHLLGENTKTDMLVPKTTSPQMQILKYMGNKRGLLDWLLPKLDEQLEYGDTFLDLFAGTSSVGYALKSKVKIIANDIQEYSAIISMSLLDFNDKIDETDFDKDLAKSYRENLLRLIDIFGEAIQAEEKLITTEKIRDYQNFSANIPRYGELVLNDRFKLNRYSNEAFIQNRRIEKTKFPYILFSVYFPNTFFGLKQCLDIDSIRYAIDKINNKQKRAVYLSCLMYAMSKAVNSSGHFAEYLNHHSEQSSKLIFKQRRVSVLDHFLFKLAEFAKLYVQENWKNEIYNCDYKVLIERLYKSQKLDTVNLIYIDPPYTEAQYSRFYHIPETLVKYDYPSLTLTYTKTLPVKGRYRNDRHQSKFSQKGEVEKAFREMFNIISGRTPAKLAVSYSDNSLLKPVDKLIEIAKEYYKIIDKKNGHNHSAQGSKFTSNGKGSRDIHEYLLICTPKV